MFSENDTWMTQPSSPLLLPSTEPQPWLQLVGHAESFQVGENGRLLKRHCGGEERCFRRLMEDRLSAFVPSFHGVVQREGRDYTVMDNLLTRFHAPAIMDCKMGTRTYQEEELRLARERPKLRQDMYEKMVAVDPGAPTAQEGAQRGVLKTRYMQWRESLSSTTTQGFRIEGVRKANGECRTNFKRTKSREQVAEALRDFVDRDPRTVRGYLSRLKQLRRTLEASQFFRTHEVVGSSLLFLHDAAGRSGVWMIDFGKTSPLPPPLTLDHRTPWVEGNREDGYLWGLDNLIAILTDSLLPPARTPGPPEP